MNPQNHSLDDVVPKIAILNALYQTQVYGVYRMAEHIVSQHLDILLNRDRLCAVDRVRGGHGFRTKTGQEWDFYSFATKYCHFHRPETYPIYDSFVSVGLHRLSPFLGSGKRVTYDSMLDYTLFSKLVDRVRADIWPGRPGFKRIDQALWVLGALLEGEADREISRRAGPLPENL